MDGLVLPTNTLTPYEDNDEDFTGSQTGVEYGIRL